MTNYECQICNFSTHVKCNYNRHLTTKKHLKNVSELTKNDKNEQKNEQKMSKMSIFVPKKITEQNPKSLSFSGKNTHFICSFCS